MQGAFTKCNEQVPFVLCVWVASAWKVMTVCRLHPFFFIHGAGKVETEEKRKKERQRDREIVTRKRETNTHSHRHTHKQFQ